MPTKTIVKRALIVSEDTISINFSSAHINQAQIEIIDKDCNKIEIKEIKKEETTLYIKANLDINSSPYELKYEDKAIKVQYSYEFIDKNFYYTNDDLGVNLKDNGTASLKLWSPLAKDVKVIIYDKNDQDLVIADNIPMVCHKGIWTVDLEEKNTGLKNLNSYYYNYKIDNEGKGNYKIALDPYAKSMATWNNKKYSIGKAAIVNPSNLGKVLNYANMPNYKKREDAIIYEVHVRDFTVDPSIEGDLSHRFGTFRALINKLPYIKDLGVTHIQLLPIMSYFNVDENHGNKREMNWSSQHSNYNWGYDPHSYFSLSGMYSENPNNPEKRIEEFKELVNEIHKLGMAVTLDVVFNHTASVHIFEDLVPNYYHFMDEEGNTKSSFGGGRLGTTHLMARKILVDSILYFTKEFKVDGFRFDMMGDHDAETIQIAYDQAKKINPNILMIGEGWRTFTGDDGDKRMPADQDWMQHTEACGVFSDEIRDELKSGYNSEGEPRFITGGKRNIGLIFDNIIAKPHNFVSDQPGDVVQYIEAHDNLTLHDVIAYSIKKDPEFYEEEIQKRIRIGNALVLTSQGTAFLHGGQEYGRSKQWKGSHKPLHKETFMTDVQGKAFTHPYFIHDSYNSSDIINMFDWEKALNYEKFKDSALTRDYTKGLIALRKSTDAFRLPSFSLIEKNVSLVYPEREVEDLIIAYKTKATDHTEFYVFVNGDEVERTFFIKEDLENTIIIADEKEVTLSGIKNPKGVNLEKDKATLAPLTVVILKKLK